ncbi:hypothetical protein NUW54_g10181 [Trametes sanguinea]|uniref:Uncharacterized protein n=1 Tax=Trametes sanguinea TaxID=158606 RepID=A0ACC1P231_9APHY|nr:hypothetical protein NUW54_g10181 [Trametes sanguinea]
MHEASIDRSILQVEVVATVRDGSSYRSHGYRGYTILLPGSSTTHCWDVSAITTIFLLKPRRHGHRIDFTSTPNTLLSADGLVGAVAMRYENPISKSLNWRKTWFFLENDVQFVMVARITSSTSAPVFSVLDQRKHVGEVLVNGAASGGGNFSSPSTLWHGGVGYVFNTSDPVTLSVDVSTKTGSWSAIGASSQPPVTVDMFTAWLSHNDISSAISYIVFPATTPDTFQQKVAAANLHTIRNDGSISALLDIANEMAFLVFWETNGGSVTIPALAKGGATLKVQSTGSANVILRMNTWTVTVADPTQLLSTLTLTFTLGSGTAPAGWGSSKTKTLQFTLPSGGVAGSSLTQNLPA